LSVSISGAVSVVADGADRFAVMADTFDVFAGTATPTTASLLEVGVPTAGVDGDSPANMGDTTDVLLAAAGACAGTATATGAGGEDVLVFACNDDGRGGGGAMAWDSGRSLKREFMGARSIPSSKGLLPSVWTLSRPSSNGFEALIFTKLGLIPFSLNSASYKSSASVVGRPSVPLELVTRRWKWTTTVGTISLEISSNLFEQKPTSHNPSTAHP
jgi:hypothetical protein